MAILKDLAIFGIGLIAALIVLLLIPQGVADWVYNLVAVLFTLAILFVTLLIAASTFQTQQDIRNRYNDEEVK